jgi:hypothetical protein
MHCCRWKIEARLPSEEVGSGRFYFIKTVSGTNPGRLSVTSFSVWVKGPGRISDDCFKSGVALKNARTCTRNFSMIISCVTIKHRRRFTFYLDLCERGTKVRSFYPNSILVFGTIGRSRWPRGLRRGPMAARLLSWGFGIPPGAWMLFPCECGVCQVEVSGSGWSLIQSSHTDCGVSTECDREAP